MGKHDRQRNGESPAPLPMPGMPSAAAALADALAGRDAPPPLPHATGGETRAATAEDIMALKLIDAQESVLGLRRQTVEQAERIAGQEGTIAKLLGIIRTMEQEKLSREIIAMRQLRGYTASSVLREDFATGKVTVGEKEAPRA